MARPYRRRAVSSFTPAYSHDPLERIDSIAGVNSDRSRWSLTQTAAISLIEAGTDEFFVTADGHPVSCRCWWCAIKNTSAPNAKNLTQTT